METDRGDRSSNSKMDHAGSTTCYSKLPASAAAALPAVTGRDPRMQFTSPFIGPRGIVAGRTIMALAKDEVQFATPLYFMYCGLGGLLACGVTHWAITPLDLVKCRLQVDKNKYKNIPHGFKVTLAEGGVAGLMLGWAPTLIGYSLQGTGKFGFYEMAKVYFTSVVSAETAYTYRTSIFLTASAFAEFLADILLCPFEACKVRIQTLPGFTPKLSEALPKIFNEEGLAGLYKGLLPLWGRQVPYTMMKFTSFERIIEAMYIYVTPKPRAQCSKGEQLTVTFISGYLAGILCAVVSHPADTMVSKMNKEKDSTAGEIYKRIGFSGLWAGLVMRIFMIGTLTGLQWFIYDSFKVSLGIPRPPPPEMPASMRGK